MREEEGKKKKAGCEPTKEEIRWSDCVVGSGVRGAHVIPKI